MIRRQFLHTAAAATVAGFVAGSRHTAAASEGARAFSWEIAPGFIRPKEGRQTIGQTHGNVGVDSAGQIYVSVEGQPEGGMQVFSPEGKYLRHLKGTPDTLHGFVIRKEADGEFIYTVVLGQSRVLKMKTDGEVVLEIPASAFPSEVAGKALNGLKLTSCDVAANGDIIVVDGYGSDFIFVFGKDGKFKKAFGGKEGPLKLNTCHMLFVDRRFTPERLLLVDRGNGRLLHTDLDGNLVAEAVTGLRMPCAASFYQDLVCVAELGGRVTVFDKEGKPVAELGRNDTPGESNTPNVPPDKWRDGVVTSPHGIAFDAKGNILESEWNRFGRVQRWNLKA